MVAFPNWPMLLRTVARCLKVTPPVLSRSQSLKTKCDLCLGLPLAVRQRNSTNSLQNTKLREKDTELADMVRTEAVSPSALPVQHIEEETNIFPHLALNNNKA